MLQFLIAMALYMYGCSMIGDVIGIGGGAGVVVGLILMPFIIYYLLKRDRKVNPQNYKRLGKYNSQREIAIDFEIIGELQADPKKEYQSPEGWTAPFYTDLGYETVLNLYLFELEKYHRCKNEGFDIEETYFLRRPELVHGVPFEKIDLPRGY